MEGDTEPLCRSILQRSRIFHTLRGIQDLDPDDIAILVIVEDDPGFILITFLNWSPQYLAILLVR